LEGLIEDITDRHRIEEMAIRVETLRKAIQGATTALSAVTESRDPMTAEHQNRVARLAVAIAREMHLPADRIEAVRVAALLHDIGKIYIPLAVLNRSDRLAELEFGMVEAHPEVGYSILKSVERETEPFPWPIAEIIHQHHERIDGSGYPQGLQGDAILLEARILAIADVVSAMLSPRPYRSPIPISEVLEEIERHMGIQFDERATRACLSLFRDGGFTFKSAI
jgi:putative nucleotidyltransferase with HDIG domain